MRRTDTVILLTALCASLGGCRGLSFFSAPLPTEHQMPINQLVFHSNFDLPKNNVLIRELTAERDEIAGVLCIPPGDEQIHVYLFRDEDEYRRYLAETFPMVPARRALFVETDAKLAVYAHWSDRFAEDLRHEVAHGYMHASGLKLPLWLDEGLAEYFEVPRGGKGLNRPHLQLLADLMEHNDWQPDLKRLERLTSAAEMHQADYAESWAWVYCLLNSEPERREILTEYLVELRDEGSAEPLSKRLASRHVEPQRTLAEYLVALDADQGVSKK